MTRLKSISAFAFAICFSLLLQPHLHAADLKRLSAGEATVLYPAGLEAQARKVADVVAVVVPKLMEKSRTLDRALADRRGIGRRIGDILGYTEYASDAERIFSQTLGKQVDPPPWTRFRLFREDEVKVSGSVTDGPVLITYDKHNDRFTVNYVVRSATDLHNLFVPVGVMHNGAIRTGTVSLERYLKENTETFLAAPFAAIHEAVEWVLIRKLGLYYPCARWFNDGLANWVTLKIVQQIAPSLLSACQHLMLPTPADANFRESVNLPAWPQVPYAPRSFLAVDADIDTIPYRYATEAVDRCLHAAPDEALTKILHRTQDRRQTSKLNTDALCEIITDATGKDAKAILLEYVPPRVRKGITEKQAPVLLQEARIMTTQSLDLGAAAKLIEEALAIQPDDIGARINLAILGRKAGYPKAECERQIAYAAALAFWDRTAGRIGTTTTDDDVRYVFGRFSQRMGQQKSAKRFLSQVTSSSPWYPNAQKALKEIAQPEKPAP